MHAFMKKLDNGVQSALRILCIMLFCALGLILLTNVAMRVMNDFSIFLTTNGMAGAGAMVKKLTPITSMHWFDEIVELCFAWLVFYGSAALWGTKGHFSVGDWISARLPYQALKALYKLLVTLLSAIFIGVFLYFSFNLLRRTTELSTVFQIPKWVMYSSMTVGSAIMLAYSVADIYLDILALLGIDASGSQEQASQSM